MGTNYYWQQECCDKCGRGDKKVHIGKSSAGWPFSVHIIPEEGIHSWQDWHDRLRSGEIVDEYGDIISLEKLDNLVKLKRSHATDEHVLQSYKDYPDYFVPCPTGDKLSYGDFS